MCLLLFFILILFKFKNYNKIIETLKYYKKDFIISIIIFSMFQIWGLQFFTFIFLNFVVLLFQYRDFE